MRSTTAKGQTRGEIEMVLQAVRKRIAELQNSNNPEVRGVVSMVTDYMALLAWWPTIGNEDIFSDNPVRQNSIKEQALCALRNLKELFNITR